MELTLKQIQQNLKVAQGTKKSYADLKRTFRVVVGEPVYITNNI